MSSNPALYRFHGGLQLPDFKHMSMQRPLQDAGIPDQLVLRINQHIGEPNTPLVKAGDHIKKRQLLARSREFVSAPVHAPTSGYIRAIEQRPIAHASGMTADCFVIEPDGVDEGIEPSSEVGRFHQLTDKDALLKRIREYGLVGLGGAVFPTAAKIRTAQQYGIDTLIINGAECEPYITCDDMLMQTAPDQVVRGIQCLQAILQPRRTLIGIEDNKPAAIDAIQSELDQTDLKNTQVVSIPSLYPSGGEKQLIKILTGTEVISGQLSFEIGIFCQNVGTCAAIAAAVHDDQPLISRVVSVTGPGVKNPGNWITRLGTPISWLIDKAGGYGVDQPRLIMGGPMMGLTLSSDQVSVVKATNNILVLDERDQPVARECVRCGRCAEVCPAMLLPQQLYWYSKARQFDRTEDYHLFDCIECGCCASVCPSHIPLVQYYRFAKSEIWEQRRNAWKSDLSRKRHEFREARLLKQKQRDEERRRQKREALARKKAAQEAAKGKAAEAKTGQSEDLIKAALERVKARKQAQQSESLNTTDLTPEQQRQIDEANARRQRIKQDKQ